MTKSQKSQTTACPYCAMIISSDAPIYKCTGDCKLKSRKTDAQ